MNEEIKEILKDLFKDENVNGFILSDERYKELKDYITNLQQENKKLQITVNKCKQEIERLNNIINEVNKQLNYLETYSSKEDVFEDMKRRLESIEKIINKK